MLDSRSKLSITNVAVYTFLFITAFKALFSGVQINLSMFIWKVEGLDMAATLPLLFSLMNYGHKRQVEKKVGNDVSKQ
jgi:hypothetical protein